MPLALTPQAFPTDGIQRFEVDAEGLGRYTIDVSLPRGWDKGDARYPVILVTDGNVHFDTVHAQVNGFFSREAPSIAPSIVVGVGYPADEGSASWYARRNFDFFGPWEMNDALGQTLRMIHAMLVAGEKRAAAPIRAGGYPRFISFIRDELLPALAARFPVALDAAHTVVGHSSGGHFVLRALYDVTSPFKRYVAVSPTFGGADNPLVHCEADFAAARDDLDVDLFVSCAKEEVGESQMSALCRFGTSVAWTVEQIATRQWKSARVQWEVMEHEDHASTFARAVSAGLRSVHRRRPGVHAAEIRAATEAAMRELQQKGASPSS